MDKGVHISKENGFTLLEVILVIIILGIISGVIVNLMNRQAETFTSVINNSDLLSNGRKAIEVIRRDLHEISATDITIMTAANLTFSTMDDTTIVYKMSAGTLLRNDLPVAEYLLYNPFSYLDADQNATALNTDLIFINLKLQMGKLSENVEIEEIIYLRN